MVWKILNYEQPRQRALAKKFEIQMPVVVLARMKDGEIEDWKRLDEVWALVGDKPAFAKYVRDEIERMLAPDKKPTPARIEAGRAGDSRSQRRSSARRSREGAACHSGSRSRTLVFRNHCQGDRCDETCCDLLCSLSGLWPSWLPCFPQAVVGRRRPRRIAWW